MPTQMAEPATRLSPVEARYRTLVNRVLEDLRLALDAGEAAGVHVSRLARLKRARRELNDEREELQN